jgi:hypothetical protein
VISACTYSDMHDMELVEGHYLSPIVASSQGWHSGVNSARDNSARLYHDIQTVKNAVR